MASAKVELVIDAEMVRRIIREEIAKWLPVPNGDGTVTYNLTPQYWVDTIRPSATDRRGNG